jgi:hypothetical protein
MPVLPSQNRHKAFLAGRGGSTGLVFIYSPCRSQEGRFGKGRRNSERPVGARPLVALGEEGNLCRAATRGRQSVRPEPLLLSQEAGMGSYRGSSEPRATSSTRSLVPGGTGRVYGPCGSFFPVRKYFQRDSLQFNREGMRGGRMDS